jgi:hypothetical protein
VYGSVASLVAGKLKHDGYDDIVVGFSNDDYVPVFSPVGSSCIYDGFGVFDHTAWSGPLSVRMLDMDGDKQLDIVTASSAGLAFGSSSDAQLTGYPLSTGTHVIAAGDFTGDGKDDVAVFQSSFGVRIYRSAGSGFSPGSVYYQVGEVMALAAGDMDKDGDLDLIALRALNKVAVLRNEGVSGGNVGLATLTPNVSLNGGSFATTEEPTDFVLIDFDKDGALDVVVGSVTGGSIKFLRNDGSGKLTLIGEATQAAGITAIGAVDVNGDQHMDIVATSADHGSLGSARLLVFVADP